MQSFTLLNMQRRTMKSSPCAAAAAYFLLALVSVLLISCAAMAAASSSSGSSPDFSTAILVRVDQSGKGDFTKIQDAIDAVPSNNTEQYFVWIKPGIYREKIVVPGDKPFIILSGTNAMSTIISWDEAWDNTDSPTVSILASDFVGRYLTIQNTYGSSGPAVALRVAGDRAAFYTCRFLSYQDTLLDDSGRHYYSNCYIEGATDFICGDARSLFEKCHLHSISQQGGAVTAQRRSNAADNTGYSFSQCRITGIGHGTAILGRPWGPYSRVVFVYTYMTDAISAEGWNDWDNADNQRTTYYGQYKCYGPGANTTGRVGWSRELTLQEAAPLTTKTWINGQQWLRPSPSHFKRRQL